MTQILILLNGEIYYLSYIKGFQWNIHCIIYIVGLMFGFMVLSIAECLHYSETKYCLSCEIVSLDSRVFEIRNKVLES